MKDMKEYLESFKAFHIYSLLQLFTRTDNGPGCTILG